MKKICAAVFIGLWCLTVIMPVMAEEPPKTYKQLFSENEELRSRTTASSQIVATYKVVKGDSLSSIAIKVEVDKKDLRAANPGVDFGALVAGTAIRYPVDIQKEIGKTNDAVTNLGKTVDTLKTTVSNLVTRTETIAKESATAVSTEIKKVNTNLDSVFKLTILNSALILLAVVMIMFMWTSITKRLPKNDYEPKGPRS
jgi:LysM repeat protein